MKQIKILIGCEYSNIVASAFRGAGFKTYSCDIIENDFPSSFHLQCDIFEAINYIRPQVLIAFPPCTYLCKAQFCLLKKEPCRWCKSIAAKEFFKKLYFSDVKYLCLENPIGSLSTSFMHPSQIINPCNFGDPHAKDVCLWLRNLPPLINTCYNTRKQKVSNHVNGRMSQAQKSKIKSKFFPSVANAMVQQWESLLV